MIVYKTEEEIELLKASNELVSKTLGEVAKRIRPGVTTKELDKIAEEYIQDHGAKPGFKGYQGFPNVLCTSVNNQVVHGIPNDQPLKEGDIVSIDCGVLLNEYYGDSAYTFKIGTVSEAIDKLLEITKASLYMGIEQAIEGNRVGDIGYAIQNYCEAQGFSVVREMVGHGLGKSLHESPEIPNYGKRGRGSKLKRGLVICIEPMINLGRKDIVQEKDGWTIRTFDKKPSAHYELAVAVNKGKAETLSTFKYIEEALKN
ncbi:MAG: type I methionyl aminopeptidase [Bacteroidetes bacterium]|nr:type I methionyl aminopeptidase [Bacteroidota bacterium]